MNMQTNSYLIKNQPERGLILTERSDTSLDNAVEDTDQESRRVNVSQTAGISTLQQPTVHYFESYQLKIINIYVSIIFLGVVDKPLDLIIYSLTYSEIYLFQKIYYGVVSVVLLFTWIWRIRSGMKNFAFKKLGVKLVLTSTESRLLAKFVSIALEIFRTIVKRFKIIDEMFEVEKKCRKWNKLCDNNDCKSKKRCIYATPIRHLYTLLIMFVIVVILSNTLTHSIFSSRSTDPLSPSETEVNENFFQKLQRKGMMIWNYLRKPSAQTKQFLKIILVVVISGTENCPVVLLVALADQTIYKFSKFELIWLSVLTGVFVILTIVKFLMWMSTKPKTSKTYNREVTFKYVMIIIGKVLSVTLDIVSNSYEQSITGWTKPYTIFSIVFFVIAGVILFLGFFFVCLCRPPIYSYDVENECGGEAVNNTNGRSVDDNYQLDHIHSD